jgi:hypothetical protein
MPNDRTEYLLDEIGRLLAEDVAYPLDGTLLYAVLDTNYVAPSIFKDRGDHILYRSPDLDRLGEALLDLWEAEEADERWTEIEYLDEIDPDEEPLDRRRRIVAQHFGNKPIVYPPSGGEEGAIQFRL